MSLSNTQKTYWERLITKQLHVIADSELRKLGTTKEDLIQSEQTRILTDSGVIELLDDATSLKAQAKALEETAEQLLIDAYKIMHGKEPYSRYHNNEEAVTSKARSVAVENVDRVIARDPQYAEVQHIYDLIDKVPVKINMETSPSRLAEWLREFLPQIGIETEFDL